MAVDARPARQLVKLLERDPDLGRFLALEDLDEATATVAVVAVSLLPGPWRPAAESTAAAPFFGAIVLSGLLTLELEIAGQPFARFVGPGDVLHGADTTLSPNDGTVFVRSPAQVAMLGGRFLAATRRWPGLTAAVVARGAEQLQRLTVERAICQQPRVEMRVLGLLWQLAERWGRVTPSGVVLPLALTHELLGQLVGARRPTVTLALKELITRGAVVRRSDRTWVLLEPAPAVVAPGADQGDSDDVVVRAPMLPLPARRSLVPALSQEEVLRRRRLELLESLARLRATHVVLHDRISAQLQVMAARRAANAELCQEIRAARLRRADADQALDERPRLRLVSSA